MIRRRTRQLVAGSALTGISVALLSAPGCSSSGSGGDGDSSSGAQGSGAGGSGGAETASGGADPGTGGLGGAASGGDGTGGTESELPELLSETGLYEDIGAETLAAGVEWFVPSYLLWSDGATKERWVYLPPGTQIDTSDMDNWTFPVGTKLWKEFTRDGVRVETRMITRTKEGGRGWTGVAYIWNEDQTDAVAAPDGMNDAGGTDHDVPASGACINCHGERDDWPLGFSALQLSHDPPGATLLTWGEAGALTEPATANFAVPGAGVMQDTLGYLHANCGGCHREGSSGDFRTQLRMWLTVDKLDNVMATDTYTYIVNQPTQAGTSTLDYRVYGGEPDQSELVRRMSLRGEGQMPPLGTELPDADALTMIESWVGMFGPPAAGGAGGI